jgi:hypothetical protein
MNSRFRKLRGALLGATAAALALATTTALAGSGAGSVFNLGQANSVDGQTVLTGNPGGNPQLKLVNGGTGAAVRADSKSGIGVNGTSISGIGQFGQSQSGTGLLGLHADATGPSPGVEGRTNSTDPNGAGVIGRNTGGGPGLRAIVSAGAPPLAVNSQAKVLNLNVDLLDGLDSGALQRRVGDACNAGQAVRSVNADGTVSCEPVGLTGAWGLSGNGGTSPGSFIGTTDASPFVLKANNAEALRLTAGGNVGIGTSSPAAKLEVSIANGAGTAIAGSGGAVGVYGATSQSSTSSYGILGQAPALASGVRGVGGNGGWFSSVDANGTGVVGTVTGAGHGVRGEAGPGGSGVRGIGGNGGEFSSVDPNGTGVVGKVTGAGHGVRGEAGASGIGVFGTSTSGRGVYGKSDSSDGVRGESITSTGVYGTSKSWNGVRGDSETQAGVAGVSGGFDGVYGVTSSPDNAGVSGHGGKFGLWGYGGTGIWAGSNNGGWAAQFAGNVDVQGYLKLKVFTDFGQAPTTDCDETSEIGRMAVMTTPGGGKYLLVCFGNWYAMTVP